MIIINTEFNNVFILSLYDIMDLVTFFFQFI